MALNDTLGTTPPMLLRDYGSLSPQQQKTVTTETLPAAREQVSELGKQEAAQTIAAGREFEQKTADTMRRMAQQGRRDIEQAYGEMREPEAFVAPRRSPEELASTAFGDLILGLMVGGIAKASSISQLQAIKGMQDARQKNSQAEYDMAYKSWETAEKQKEAFNKRVLDKLKRVQELMPLDKAAAQSELNLLKPELNEGIAQIKLAKGDLAGAIASVEKAVETDKKNKQKMQELEFQRQTQLAVAREKESGKPKGILKPSAKILEGFIANNILSLDLKGLTKDLQDPELAKHIMDYRAEAFATEELGKIAAQILQPELPEKLRRFLTKVRDIRNNYYLDISGKAVTGGEAMRNYGTVPTPGDTPEVIRDKINGMVGRLDSKISLTRSLYELPDMSSLPIAAGQKTNLQPNENYEEGAAQEIPRIDTQEEYNKLPPGAIYIDAKDGKRYRKPKEQR